MQQYIKKVYFIIISFYHFWDGELLQSRVLNLKFHENQGQLTYLLLQADLMLVYVYLQSRFPLINNVDKLEIDKFPFSLSI